jgi:hypothetical protein
MDPMRRWDTFLRTYASVPTTHEELTAEQRPAVLNALSSMGEQIASAAQAVSRFLEPLLNPPPEVAEGVIDFVRAMKVFNDAMKAYGGDPEEAIFWVLALGHLERKPDSFLSTKLKDVLRRDDFDEMPLSDFWALLNRHKGRLTRDSELESVQRQTAAIRRGIKKYPSVDLALNALATEEQTCDEVLEDMIPGVAYVERSKSPPPAKLPGKVANQIRREGLERPDDPGKVFAPGPEGLLEHADELELATFAVCEQLAHMAEKAGVSEQEWESFVFGTVFGNQEAAEILDRPAKQVGVEKFRASNKLRPPA